MLSSCCMTRHVWMWCVQWSSAQREHRMHMARLSSTYTFRKSTRLSHRRYRSSLPKGTRSGSTRTSTLMGWCVWVCLAHGKVILRRAGILHAHRSTKSCSASRVLWCARMSTSTNLTTNTREARNTAINATEPTRISFDTSISPILYVIW